LDIHRGSHVIGNTVFGASLEGDWRGIGWRVEGVHSWLDRADEDSLFWIAGLDYQFDDATLITAEWYDNGRGATHEADLPTILNDPLVIYRLQQQLGRRMLGIGVTKTITPLLQGNYTMLASILQDVYNRPALSTLHQLNFVYSLSNESDLLLSLLVASGKGLVGPSVMRSEFGHLPPSVAVRFRRFF